MVSNPKKKATPKPSRGEGSSREQRAELVYRELRNRIVTGQLGPGARIVEREIAERLKVSRTPVRDAVRRLQRDGLILENPSESYSRPVVAGLSGEDARELHDIVARLESVAVRRVAGLPKKERDSLVEQMRAANEELKRAGSNPEVRIAELVTLDHAFHRIYLESGSGARLSALRETVKPQLERYAHHYAGRLIDQVDLSVREHDAIIRAIRLGDVDAAEVAVLTNWMNSAERLRKAIEISGDREGW